MLLKRQFREISFRISDNHLGLSSWSNHHNSCNNVTLCFFLQKAFLICFVIWSRQEIGIHVLLFMVHGMEILFFCLFVIGKRRFNRTVILKNNTLMHSKGARPLRRERETFCSTVFYTDARQLKRELEWDREHKTLGLAFLVAGFGLEAELYDLFTNFLHI